MSHDLTTDDVRIVRELMDAGLESKLREYRSDALASALLRSRVPRLHAKLAALGEKAKTVPATGVIRKGVR